MKDFMPDLNDFCEKHGIEVACDIRCKWFTFIKDDNTTKYYFCKGCDGRGPERFLSQEKFKYLIKKLKHDYNIEEG